MQWRHMCPRCVAACAGMPHGVSGMQGHPRRSCGVGTELAMTRCCCVAWCTTSRRLFRGNAQAPPKKACGTTTSTLPPPRRSASWQRTRLLPSLLCVRRSNTCPPPRCRHAVAAHVPAGCWRKPTSARPKCAGTGKWHTCSARPAVQAPVRPHLLPRTTWLRSGLTPSGA